jgi:hypothetical protein
VVYVTVLISSSSGYRYVTCFLVGKNTRRVVEAPFGPLGATEFARRFVSKGELRRMLFTPSGSWYGLLEVYGDDGLGKRGFEALDGEAVAEDGYTTS